MSYLAPVVRSTHKAATSNTTLDKDIFASLLSDINGTQTVYNDEIPADATAGKTVTIASMPVGSSAGTLSIKTAPNSARATATIAGNVLTVKPVAAGEATSVVVTNGKVDVTITITVAE